MKSKTPAKRKTTTARKAPTTRKAATTRKAPIRRKKMQAGGSLGESIPQGYQDMSPGRLHEVMKQNQESGQRSRRRMDAIPPPISAEARRAARRRSAAESNAAQRRSDVAAKRLEDAVAIQRTGGGNYGTYQRGSQTAASFREAYSNAKRAGKDTFTWRNRRYTTE